MVYGQVDYCSEVISSGTGLPYFPDVRCSSVPLIDQTSTSNELIFAYELNNVMFELACFQLPAKELWKHSISIFDERITEFWVVAASRSVLGPIDHSNNCKIIPASTSKKN